MVAHQHIANSPSPNGSHQELHTCGRTPNPGDGHSSTWPKFTAMRHAHFHSTSAAGIPRWQFCSSLLGSKSASKSGNDTLALLSSWSPKVSFGRETFFASLLRGNRCFENRCSVLAQAVTSPASVPCVLLLLHAGAPDQCGETLCAASPSSNLNVTKCHATSHDFMLLLLASVFLKCSSSGRMVSGSNFVRSAGHPMGEASRMRPVLEIPKKAPLAETFTGSSSLVSATMDMEAPSRSNFPVRMHTARLCAR